MIGGGPLPGLSLDLAPFNGMYGVDGIQEVGDTAFILLSVIKKCLACCCSGPYRMLKTCFKLFPCFSAGLASCHEVGSTDLPRREEAL